MTAAAAAAKPQPPAVGGQTPIAHPVLEALYASPMTGAELRICLAVVRESYGTSQPDASLSLTEIAARTGLRRDTVKRKSAGLVRAGVLEVVTVTNHVDPRKLRLVRNCTRWGTLTPDPLPEAFRVAAVEGGGRSAPTPPAPPAAPGGAPPKNAVAADAKLRLFLGPHAAAAFAAMGSVPGQGAGWASSVVVRYIPPGAQHQAVWESVAPQDVPRLLADSLSRFGGAGRRFHPQAFDEYVTDTVHQYFHGKRKRDAEPPAERTHSERRAASPGAPGRGGRPVRARSVSSH